MAVDRNHHLPHGAHVEERDQPLVGIARVEIRHGRDDAGIEKKAQRNAHEVLAIELVAPDDCGDERDTEEE